MNDITEIIFKYKEAARHLWNSAFQFLEDGDDEFDEVNNRLFISLVFNQVSPYIREEEIKSEYIPSIEVMPEFGPRGAIVMFAFQSGNTWNWEEIRLTEKSIKLKFMYFFDWKEYKYREFQYARARIIECPEHKNIVGADMLIESHMCQYYRV